DQCLFQPLAVVGRIAQAEALPLVLGQAALCEILARRLADVAAQIGGEPLLGQVHPVGEALTLLFALGGMGVFGRKLHPRLARQSADRLDEAEPLRLLQKGDDVAVLARAEVVEEALVVIDEEAGRLLLREGAQADELASLTLELHRPPDDVGRPKAGLQLFNEPLVKSHLGPMPSDGGRKPAPAAAPTGRPPSKTSPGDKCGDNRWLPSGERL